ncbi:MAG: hypothetical protein C0597_04175 [Marinilabiliales bacterium]|nr:MAG: hypothetical protein C0597_04175 [Marinilabiliales bacterium]
MNKLIIVALLISLHLSLFSQDCEFYYPKTEGAKLEYTSYDAKDKITGSSIQIVKKLETQGNITSAIIEVQSFDKKGKDLGSKEYGVKCEKGIYSVDMKSFMDQATMEAYEDMEVNVSSDNLEIPANLNVGDELGDGNLNISIYSDGMKIMGMSTDISQRIVDSKEEITTKAGTFECYKITYTITIKTMFSVRMEAAEWICEDIGTVKSETYSRGKSMGYTLLTGITK